MSYDRLRNFKQAPFTYGPGRNQSTARRTSHDSSELVIDLRHADSEKTVLAERSAGRQRCGNSEGVSREYRYGGNTHKSAEPSPRLEKYHLPDVPQNRRRAITPDTQAYSRRNVNNHQDYHRDQIPCGAAEQSSRDTDRRSGLLQVDGLYSKPAVDNSDQQNMSYGYRANNGTNYVESQSRDPRYSSQPPPSRYSQEKGKTGLGRKDSQAYEAYVVQATDDRPRSQGLTVPITRAVEDYVEETKVKETWHKTTTSEPVQVTKQIKLDCNQKVVVKGERVKKVIKDVPITRTVMVKTTVPVKKKVTRLVCVPVVKTIEVESTDVREIVDYVEEMEEKWVEKTIVEGSRTEEQYIREPYEKVVTIPYVQIQEVKKTENKYREQWEKRMSEVRERKQMLREEVAEEDLLTTLRKSSIALQEKEFV